MNLKNLYIPLIAAAGIGLASNNAAADETKANDVKVVVPGTDAAVAAANKPKANKKLRGCADLYDGQGQCFTEKFASKAGLEEHTTGICPGIEKHTQHCYDTRSTNFNVPSDSSSEGNDVYSESSTSLKEAERFSLDNLVKKCEPFFNEYIKLRDTYNGTKNAMNAAHSELIRYIKEDTGIVTQFEEAYKKMNPKAETVPQLSNDKLILGLDQEINKKDTLLNTVPAAEKYQIFLKSVDNYANAVKAWEKFATPFEQTGCDGKIVEDFNKNISNLDSKYDQKLKQLRSITAKKEKSIPKFSVGVSGGYQFPHAAMLGLEQTTSLGKWDFGVKASYNLNSSDVETTTFGPTTSRTGSGDDLYSKTTANKTVEITTRMPWSVNGSVGYRFFEADGFSVAALAAFGIDVGSEDTTTTTSVSKQTYVTANGQPIGAPLRIGPHEETDSRTLLNVKGGAGAEGCYNFDKHFKTCLNGYVGPKLTVEKVPKTQLNFETNAGIKYHF
ncbi:MAG: hypothetical protein ABH824_03195 [Nanoarchaeota archaeon]|nr:hypothetical protein [Nanoarchaeota archaeon]MBU1631895.1 hypothetical protein [Nanoarchaeota archaeon]MBU1875918.1 hypothetical protein [Nanoarchaeota archaeon]